MTETQEFAYEVDMRAVVRIRATSEKTALEMLDDLTLSTVKSDRGWVVTGLLEQGAGVVTEATIREVDPEPFEINGESPDDICDTPDCWESLNDGEGWDGKCGTCADRLEAEGAFDEE